MELHCHPSNPGSLAEKKSSMQAFPALIWEVYFGSKGRVGNMGASKQGGAISSLHQQETEKGKLKHLSVPVSKILSP